MRTVILALLACVAWSPANAQECEDPQTQAEMNICAGDRYKRSDASLNDVYGKVMDRLSENKDAQSLLREAQRAWISFRDAECEFMTAGSKGGSIYPLLMAGCLTDLTDRRVKALQELIDCREDACPYP